MRQNLNYTIKICSSPDLEKRSFLTVTINGNRTKEYTGKKLNIQLEPNRAKNLKEREALLKRLEYEFRKAIEEDGYPAIQQGLINDNDQHLVKATKMLLQNALKKKLNSSLSRFYKRNMQYIHDAFTSFLTPQELDGDITNLKPSRIEAFLDRYKTSGTYYMNKRRDLGVLFSAVGKQLDIPLLTVLKTERMKSSAKLHEIYQNEQIHPVLDFVKSFNRNLHLCCLITYGCFLRPHEEVRMLTGNHFKNHFTEIHLSGAENKGRRVRVVCIPDYVRDELLERIPLLSSDINLFTLTDKPFNPAYFNTLWTRAWHKMFKEGLVNRNQTIYSFRHTAAVNVYRKTKDVHILQQLLGHSDMIVTLKYLRGLGELNLTEQKQYMPTL